MKTNARRRFHRLTRKDLFELCICILLSGLFVLLSSGTAFGQGNVGINNPTPHAKSLLDLTSSDKGLLAPRMTVAQRTAMFPGPDATAKGMLVYQTDGTPGYYYYDGAVWQMLQAGGAGWGLLGNAGTSPTTNFLGTTDNQALAVRTNNIERMRVDVNGHVGLGNAAPASKLQVTRNSAGYAPNADAVITAENSGAAYMNLLSGNSETGLLFGSAADPQNGGIIYNGGSLTNGMAFRTGGNAGRMFITGAGDVSVGDGVYWPGYKFGVIANQPSAMSVYHNTNANGYSGLHFINNASTARAHIGAGNTTSPNWANMGYAGTYTAHPFVLTTGDLERLRIDAAGNVGIGTSAPVRQLELSSPTQGVQRITTNNAVNGSVLELSNATAGNNNLGAINFLEGNTPLGQFLYHKTDGMVFRTAGPERMRIDVNGNVGIGTTAPSSKLHVSRGAAGFAPNANSGLTVEHSGNVYANVISAAGETGVLFGAAANAAHGGIVYHNTPGMMFRTGGNIERMRIDAAGNVGIGTNAPSVKLDVVDGNWLIPMRVRNTLPTGYSAVQYINNNNKYGNIGWGNSASATFADQFYVGTTSPAPMLFTTGDVERARIDATGNVGIGTTTPGSKLHVSRGASGLVPHALAAATVESAGNTYQHFLTPGNSESGLLFGSGATAVDAGVLYHTAYSLNGLDFRTGGNMTRMVIKSNGQVGIGTAAPTAELEVNGFTKHGTNAPAIKQVEFTGTTAATEGSFVDVAHGLIGSKIIDIRVLIEYIPGSWITTGHTINGEYLADYSISATTIRLYNHSTSSGNILSKPVKILVTYKA